MKFTSLVALAALYSAATFAKPVEVEGMGSTFEAAKRSAFRSAIERATGVLTISEQEISGYKLTRDYVGSYSSGWIADYEITDAVQDVNHNWIVKLRAEVRDSKIKTHSQRRNTMNGSVVHGQRQSDSLNSQLEQRDQGDRLLEVVFGSYPEHAYVINNGQTEFAINRLRQPYIDIEYSLSMSSAWLDALNAALSAVAIDEANCSTLSMVVANGAAKTASTQTKNLLGKVCGSEPDLRVFSKHSNNWFPRANSYYLADNRTLELINTYLQPASGQQHLGIQIEFLDGDGRPITSQCASVNNEMFVAYSQPHGVYNYNQLRQLSRPNIMGQNQMQGTLRIPIGNPHNIEDLAKIRLGVQKTCA